MNNTTLIYVICSLTKQLIDSEHNKLYDDDDDDDDDATRKTTSLFVGHTGIREKHIG